MWEIVLGAMLALPVYHGDREETLEQRRQLLEPLAHAITESTESRGEMAAAISQAYHESRFARYVLENRCLEGPPGSRCDNGTSRGPFQVKKWCEGAWNSGASLAEQYRAGARCMLSVYRLGVMRCQNNVGGFALQKSTLVSRGSLCRAPWAIRREELRERVYAKLKRR